MLQKDLVGDGVTFTSDIPFDFNSRFVAEAHELLTGLAPDDWLSPCTPKSGSERTQQLYTHRSLVQSKLINRTSLLKSISPAAQGR